MKGVGLNRRGAFHRESGPVDDPTRRHLHIICTNQDQHGLLLVVPLCSLKSHTRDRTCLLGVGDHPYIICRSFIDYHKAEIIERHILQEGLKRGTIEPAEDFDQDHFDLVCQGIRTSRWARPNTVRFYSSSTERDPEAA